MNNFSEIIRENLYNKRFRPTKNEPQQQGISYLEREREGAVVRQREGQAGGLAAGIFKVRFGRDREIEGRDR
jgi:hypothetical protein